MNASLEEAGAVTGASRWTIMRRVQLPLLLPAVANALIFQFTTVVQAFDVPAVIGLQAGVPLLSYRIYLASSPPVGLRDYGAVCSYSMLLVISTLPLLWYARVTRVAARFATVHGKSPASRRVQLRKLRWPAGILVGVYGIV